MCAGAVDAGICMLDFADSKALEHEIAIVSKTMQAKVVDGKCELLMRLEHQLEEYFAGSRKHFTLPLVLTGTDFQKRAWQALQGIPYGQTISYQRQAAIIGLPRSTRAVANANGSNRIAIILPCHRVIGSNGKLTGYGGGLERKKYLLDMEARFA
jgi:AraC family transcriptional regulator of adaptative response/methylated-DNA-[protein]-cysteine methyltransferase